ncbi:hypothetical protein AVEN_51484-1 [Araneus ventricosus]|uniref:Reverse transcriptase domain-containing protein n=1 Tax=Araneus ventricosus TaxID=182803 RepID=A0A4Y2VNB2_ARAVE|nr:hypothetical protein AVEN_51484-1 [Araneus ventricosus]
MNVYNLVVIKFGKTTHCLHSPRICSAIKPRASAVTLYPNTLFMELFNKCLHLGTFSDLFKNEDEPEDEASSYRPISLLPTICKVLEKLLTQRFNYHLKRLNKISDNQYGFREGRSTELAIHPLIQKIHEGKMKNPHVLVLSIDIKGAFDNI